MYYLRPEVTKINAKLCHINCSNGLSIVDRQFVSSAKHDIIAAVHAIAVSHKSFQCFQLFMFNVRCDMRF